MSSSPLRMAFLVGEACWVPPPEWQGTRFAARRVFFEGHRETHCNQSMVCTACGFPTLTLQVEGDYCSACKWEDDFSDDPCADTISQFNGGISLNQARRNVLENGTMFCEADRSWMHPSQYEQLYNDRARAHRDKLFQLLDELMALVDPADITRQWALINEHWRAT